MISVMIAVRVIAFALVLVDGRLRSARYDSSPETSTTFTLSTFLLISLSLILISLEHGLEEVHFRFKEPKKQAPSL